MHTVETESHPLAARLPFLRSEDTTLATLAAWSIGLLIFTLAGFYFGTIAGHENHPMGVHSDLNPEQLKGAIPYAIGGLTLGVLFALWITFGYTPKKLKEIESEQGH